MFLVRYIYLTRATGRFMWTGLRVLCPMMGNVPCWVTSSRAMQLHETVDCPPVLSPTNTPDVHTVRIKFRPLKQEASNYSSVPSESPKAAKRHINPPTRNTYLSIAVVFSTVGTTLCLCHVQTCPGSMSSSLVFCSEDGGSILCSSETLVCT